MPDPTLFGPENATPSDQQEFMQSDEQRLGMEQSFRHEFLDLEKHFGTRTNIYDLLEQAYNDGEIKPLNAEMYPDQPQDIRLQVAIKSVRPAIEDIEACCRHALSIDADNIIFLDKSARLHGALVHRIMPIMRLEYCKMNSIPLDRAKIPNIMFMSPVPSSTTEETLGSSSEEFLRVYGDKLEDKVTLIFDESTKSDTPYDYSKFTSEDQYQQFSNGSSHDSDRNFSVNRLSSIRKRVAKAILQTVPNVVIEAHAGNAGWVGGQLRFVISQILENMVANPLHVTVSTKEKTDSTVTTKEPEMTQEAINKQREIIDALAVSVFNDIKNKSLDELAVNNNTEGYAT